MRSRCAYLLAVTSIIFIFVQCKDSVTQTNEPALNSNPTLELDKTFLINPESDSDQSNPLTFEWENVEGAEQFQIQLSTEENFTSTVVDSMTDSTAIKLQGLPRDTTIYWQVRPIVEDKNGPWSESWNFRHVPKSSSSEPVSTELKSPTDGTEVRPTNVELQWEAVSSISDYRIQLADDENFEELLVDKEVEETSYQTSDLDKSEDYYWRVEPIAPQKETEWSEAYEFVTTADIETIPSVTLASPEHEITDQATTLNLKWEAISDISSYQLQLATSSSFSSPAVDETVENTSFEVSDLENQQTYYWRVQASGDEDSENWSKVYEFTTEAKSDAGTVASVTLVAPENETADQTTSLSLEWEAISGINSYQIQLATSSSFSSPTVDEAVENTSFEVSDLNYEQTYYWRVQATGDDDSENWSKVYEFTTENKPVPSATLVSPENETNDQATTLNLEWEEISSISSYHLQLAISEDFSSPAVDETVENTSFEVSDLDYEQTYYWRVQASGDDDSENWSKVYEFTTETEPIPSVTLLSPEDAAKDQAITLSFEWEEISDISSYQIQMATSEDFLSPEVDEQVNNTFYEVSDLKYEQTYYWRVQATGDDDSENWSSARSISTEKEPVDDGDNPNSVAGDRQALMDLYEAAGGDSWYNNSGWGNGDPSSSWHGIETDANGRVIRVDLYDNGLSGQLPESIGNLSKVKYLNTKGNKLNGEIPSTIGNMESLEWLILAGRTYEAGGQTFKEPPSPEDLDVYAYHPGKKRSSTNNFSGTIPSTIGNLSNLQFLEISDQLNITGPIPSELGNLSNLLGLYLNLNDFSGYTLPSSLGNLKKLKHLFFSDAQLEGTIPASFSNLTNLTAIDLGSSKNDLPGNSLTGDIPDFSNFTNLRHLWLSSNDLDGEWPHFWNNGNFTQLVTLTMSWNNLTGTLNSFENLPNLEHLGLVGNNMSGSIKSQLLTLPERLQILALGWNNFTGEMPQSGWPDFWQLKTLYMNDNSLSGGIPCDFWNKIDNSKLGYAWVKNNEFSSNCSSAMNNVDGKGDPNIAVGGNNF